MLRAFQVCPKALGERASREDCGVGSMLVDLRSALVGEPKAAASDDTELSWYTEKALRVWRLTRALREAGSWGGSGIDCCIICVALAMRAAPRTSYLGADGVSVLAKARTVLYEGLQVSRLLPTSLFAGRLGVWTDDRWVGFVLEGENGEGDVFERVWALLP